MYLEWLEMLAPAIVVTCDLALCSNSVNDQNTSLPRYPQRGEGSFFHELRYTAWMVTIAYLIGRSFHASYLDDRHQKTKPICTPCWSRSRCYGRYSQRCAKLKWILHCIRMIAWWDLPVFHLGEWWCMWMGEEWAPGQAGQRIRKWPIIKGERVHPCIRIHIPVPCPRFICGKVEGPEEIHCIEHLRRDSVSRSTSRTIGNIQ